MVFEPATRSSSAAASTATDLRPVILAGPGLELYPLTDAGLSPLAGVSLEGENETAPDARDVTVKALLPVGNRPMIEGVLRWVEDAGLNDVLLLAYDSQQHALSQYLRQRRQDSSLGSSLRIELQCAPEDVADMDTATLLGWASSQMHLKGDFVLLPCDLFLSASASATSVLSLTSLIESHRIDGALLTSMFFERAASNEDPKGKDNVARLRIALERDTATLLDQRDFLDESNWLNTKKPCPEVELRASLFARHPNLFVTLGLLPAHVYVCSARVLDFIRTHPALSNFRDDVVPYLCRAQWHAKERQGMMTASSSAHPLAVALARSSTARPAPPADTTASVSKPASANGTSDGDKPRRPPLRPIGASGSTYAYTSSRQVAKTDDARSHSSWETKCSIRIWRQSDGFCARGNTIGAYAELNRMVLKAAPTSSAASQRPQSGSVGSGIGTDSIAGAHLALGDKASVKRSCVGKHCSIGKNAKVATSVLMDRVVVGEGVKLDNCIIGSEARIGDRAQLKDTQVAPGAVIADGAVLTGRQIGRDEADESD